MVLTHGWGESRVHALQRVEPLVIAASRLIFWDMRGHGESGGACALGTYEVDDLLSLIEALGDSPHGVVLMGWSLGAGVSIAAASRDGRVCGVIAEAPYRLPQTPAAGVMRQIGVPHAVTLPLAMGLIGLGLGRGSDWFHPRGAAEFDRAALALRLKQPLLVLHGELDHICPLEDARAIADAAKGQLQVIPQAGHSDLWTREPSRARCREIVTVFLAAI